MKMKITLKVNALVAALLLLISSCTQKPEGYAIKGTLKGVDSGTVRLIRHNSDRSVKTLDSVTIKDGTFEFKGGLEVPEMLALKITPGNLGFQVFVENSTISVVADTAGAEHYDYTAYGMDKGANLKKVNITGSESQAVYDKFQNDPEQLKFRKTFETMNKEFDAEKNAELKEKMRSKFDSVGKLSSAWQIKWIGDYVSKNPDATAGAYIFSNYYQFNTSMPLTEMDGMLARFAGDAKKSVYYMDVAKEAELRRALLPGKVAPDFTLLKRDSTALTLSSIRGKYVMLDFWASWCKPCREAIPHWKTVYQKYHDKGFEILSVSDDSKWADWTKAMDFEKMPWTQVIDEFSLKNMPARVGTLYQTHFIPFYVLLDKEGKILVYSGEKKDIDAKLEEVFKM
jgi:thiol-disulfide isomerase/thioredoxin